MAKTFIESAFDDGLLEELSFEKAEEFKSDVYHALEKVCDRFGGHYTLSQSDIENAVEFFVLQYCEQAGIEDEPYDYKEAFEESCKTESCEDKVYETLVEDEDEEFYSELWNKNKDLLIKEWYIKEYPDDELGQEIDEKVTFEQFFNDLKEGKDIYETINVADSVIRERIFDKINDCLDVNCYKIWMNM